MRAGGGGEVPQRKDRLVSCRDVAGRRRDIIVFTDRGQVVMVVPAGETAVLAVAEVARLRAALHEALAESRLADE
jgi:hypothetical protein